MAIAYVVAGINHIWHPQTYDIIMPRWVPWPGAVNSITGVLEIILGFLLLPFSSRNIAAWGLILLLVIIFPANIQMAINYKEANHPSLWLAILRLPLQVLLIWWAYSYTKQYAFYKSKKVY
jgi:uncharacterized membrane protein